MSLQPAVALRLSKMVPRLASDQDGEVVATAKAIQRVLAANGVSLHELAAFLETGPVERIVYRERVVYRDRPAEPPPKKARKPRKKPQPKQEAPQEEIDPNKDYALDFETIIRVAVSLIFTDDLSEREQGFVETMCGLASTGRDRFHMTIKQAKWFRDIAFKILGEKLPEGRAA